MSKNNKTRDSTLSSRFALRRRALLRAVGVGVAGSVVLSGTASASGHYSGPISKTYEAAIVNPSEINTQTDNGDSPDGDEGEGEEVGRTIPKKAPEAEGNVGGGGGKAQGSCPIQ